MDTSGSVVCEKARWHGRAQDVLPAGAADRFAVNTFHAGSPKKPRLG